MAELLRDRAIAGEKTDLGAVEATFLQLISRRFERLLVVKHADGLAKPRCVMLCQSSGIFDVVNSHLRLLVMDRMRLPMTIPRSRAREDPRSEVFSPPRK